MNAHEQATMRVVRDLMATSGDSREFDRLRTAIQLVKSLDSSPLSLFERLPWYVPIDMPAAVPLSRAMPTQEASSLGLRVVSLSEFDMLEQQALHDPSLERDSSSFWEMRQRLTAEVLRDFTLVRLNGPLLQQPGQVALQQALVPAEMDEWVINTASPYWPDFEKHLDWALRERWSFPLGGYCTATKGTKCPVTSLNPVLLMACLHYDAVMVANWDSEDELPGGSRLVVPGLKWYQQQAAGEARDPSLPPRIRGWLPVLYDMREAATTDWPLEDIVQWHDRNVARLDNQQRRLLLQQLRLVRAITQGEATLLPLPRIPVKRRPLTLKQKLRKLVFG